MASMCTHLSSVTSENCTYSRIVKFETDNSMTDKNPTSNWLEYCLKYKSDIII